MVLRYKRKNAIVLTETFEDRCLPSSSFPKSRQLFLSSMLSPLLRRTHHNFLFFFLPFFLFPLFSSFFFPFSPFEFHGPPDKQSFCGASNKIFSSPARPVRIMLTSCFLLFFFWGGGEGGKGGTLVDFALFLILSTTLARKDYLSLSSRDVIT